MKKLNIAIIGHGFVGKAVEHGFKQNNLFIIDPQLGTDTSLILDKHLDAVFICVPTPMGEDGKIDASIVLKVIDELKDLNTILVLKSTVTPDIVGEIAAKVKNFVYNPEFLTERNALNDFEFPFMNVYGGDVRYTTALEYIYKNYTICKDAPSHHMSAVEASFTKYAVNSFLFTKVVFWNQFSELCDQYSADYSKIQKAIGADARIGMSHTTVPGHDGRKGSSGPCFGKDVPALINFSDKTLIILREAWNVNCDYRNAYDVPLAREQAQHIKFNKI